MLSHYALLDFSTTELLIILAIVLLLFGSKKLPELSRSIGESLKELKKAATGADELRREVKGAGSVKGNVNESRETQS